MGCTNCKGKAGCDHRKGDMFAALDRTLAELYPTRTWGEDGEAAGATFDEVAALADELSTELKAATFVRPGDDDEACDYIYVMCMGRSPCIVAVRDHGVAPPDEWRDAADRIDEQYLRVCISQRARMAAVQQVAVSATRDPDGGGWTIAERPRAGVYDAPLLPRMQKLVAILPAYDLTHLDFGEIAHAPPGFLPGAWADRFGGAPSIANYLFYAQPTTMVSTTWIGS